MVRKLLLLLLFIPPSLFSQSNDSIHLFSENLTTRFFNENQFEYVDSSNNIQSSLYNFQNYIPKGNLGNYGLPFNDLYFRSGTDPEYVGFNYSKNNYSNYFFFPQKINYFNTHTPYTELFYIVGQKAEQNFKLVFSYNVKKNWNMTVNLNRSRSDGFYLRQNTNDNFIAISSNYKSLNKRYYLLTNVIYNNVKNSENGGIANDSVFFAGGTTDKKQIEVNLNAAKRTVINKSIYFKQYLNLGPKTNDTATHNAIAPKSRLILTSLYEDNVLKYEDENPSSGYYPNIYFDSTRTFDSTYSHKIENELAWKRVDNKKHRGWMDMIGAGVSIKHQLIHLEQRERFTISSASVLYGLVNTKPDKIDTTFNNIIAGAEFFNTYSKNKFWWNLSAKYALNGYNKDDYFANAILKKSFKDSLNSIVIQAEKKLQAPDYIYNRYISNHFIWNNNFEKMQETHFTINYSMKKYNLSLSASYANYSDVLYFNDSAIAKQYKGAIPITSVVLKKDFIFYNWHLNNKITYQKVPDMAVIRVPEFILEHSLYYENDVFKHAMRLQVGASLFYISEYYANAYMPATAQFYLQDSKKYGNYPFVDFFINARIKTVRIFFKIDHLNYGFTGNNYMFTPQYPMNDRAFKLGVSWRFFD